MKKIFLLIFIVFFIAAFSVLLSIPTQKTPEIRSKAAGNTINVCPDDGTGCSYIGGDGIQQAVDAAQNGDTILLQPGRYTRRNPTDDPKIKYRYCMVNTRGKSLTIKGPGALLDGENGGLNTGSAEGAMIIGICDQGGNVTIDSLQIKQTLRPAIFLRNSNAVVKNVTFIDIDNTAIDVWMGSKVIIINNLFQGSAGPGINLLPLPGDVNAIIENNTFYGNGGAGVNFNLCNNSQPKGIVENNIIVTANSDKGIGIDCPEQQQKIADIKSSNNIIWKGKSGDCSSIEDDISKQTPCGTGEICTGTTTANPTFNGADEKGTVCVYGEGIVAGDFHPRQGSPAANVGVYSGVCADGNSAACLNFIEQQKSQLQPTVAPTDVPTQIPAPTEINPTQIIPTQPGIIIPTQPVSRPTSSDDGPPITYYIPPTMSFSNPTRKPSNNTLNPTPGNDETPIIPTVTPTPKPLIDVKKTVENAKKGINNLWNSFINFTKTILP